MNAFSGTTVPSRRRLIRPLLLAFLVLFIAPVAIAAGDLAYHGGPTHWSNWDRSTQTQVPTALAHPDARVLVMAGRTRGWKGVVAVHSWIVVKEKDGRAWRRYDVAGWGNPVRLNWWPPDLWFGQRGQVILDLKGTQAEALIPKIDAAIESYKYSQAGDYRIWPGPNSNTFVAAVLRAIPEVGATLPVNAIGRDFRPLPYAGWTDSGTGIELNLWGLLGIKLAWVEGIEINVLSLVVGIDLRQPGIKLPGFGRIGFASFSGEASAQMAR
jgi:hypothetical protein